MSDVFNGGADQSQAVTPNGAIDFDSLKAHVEKNGPYILVLQEELMLAINLVPKSDGADDAASITLSSGFTSLSTMISREQLASYGSLGGLADDFLENPQKLFAPFAEQQYIESEIRRHLGLNPEVIYSEAIPAGRYVMTLSEDCRSDPWRARRLQTILHLLINHRSMLAAVGDVSGDATLRALFPSPNLLLDLMQDHYTLGFLTGRLISEYFVRYEIEHLANKGMNYDAAQQRRTNSSGKKSNALRHQRIEAMLSEMERLVTH